MPPVARRWINSPEQPRHIYELVGLPVFHPGRDEILAGIRSCTREAAGYQNHADAAIASRALALLHELGRAESVVSDDVRFGEYQQSLIDQLRERYLERSSLTGSHAPDRLQAWLREQGVHPAAVERVVSRMFERATGSRVFGTASTGAGAPAAGSGASTPPPLSSVLRPAQESPRSRPRGSSAPGALRDDTAPPDLAPLQPIETRRRPPAWMLGAAGVLVLVLALDVAWMAGLFSRGSHPTANSSDAESTLHEAAVPDTSNTGDSSPGSSSQPSPAPGVEVHPNAAPAAGAIVDWAGTLENISVTSSPRFEVHLLISADDPDAVGSAAFEATATDDGILEQLSDYLSRYEQQLDFARPQEPGDHVRVIGRTAGLGGRRVLVESAAPLVELSSIERVGESGSRASVGESPRAETSFRFPASVRALQTLIRFAPADGTTVTVQGSFRERFAEEGTIFIAPQSGPRGVEVFSGNLPVDALSTGELIEVTGTHRGQSVFRQTDAGIAQRPVLHAEALRRVATDSLDGVAEPAESIPIGARYRGPALLIATADGAAAVRRGNDWYRLGLTDRAPGRLRWCLVDHEQACWLSGDRGLVRVHDGPPQSWTARDGAPEGPLVHLSEDSRRWIWVTSENGVCATLAEERWEIYDRSMGLRPTQLALCIEDGAGRVWAAGAGASVFQQGTFLGDQLGPQLALTILSADVDAEGRLYFGCVGGMFRIDGLNVDSLTVNDGLPPQSPISIYVDSQHRTWLGTAGGGALHLSAGEFAVEARHTLPGNLHVSRLAEDSQGVIWAATQQGLWRFEDDGWSTDALPEEYSSLSVVATIPTEAAEALWNWAGGERIDLTASEPRRARNPDRDSRPLKRIGVTSPLTGRTFRVQTGVPRRTIQNALGTPIFEREYVLDDGRRAIDVFLCPRGATQVSVLLVGYDDAPEQAVAYVNAELDIPRSEAVLQANLIAELVKEYEESVDASSDSD